MHLLERKTKTENDYVTVEELLDGSATTGPRGVWLQSAALMPKQSVHERIIRRSPTGDRHSFIIKEH